jgi:hypothetical protein
MKRRIHDVEAVSADDTFLHLTVDGQSYRVRWVDCSPILAAAPLFDKQAFEVSPSGYGISWLRLDEDLAIGPLLAHAEADGPAEQTEPQVAASR